MGERRIIRAHEFEASSGRSVLAMVRPPVEVLPGAPGIAGTGSGGSDARPTEQRLSELDKSISRRIGSGLFV